MTNYFDGKFHKVQVRLLGPGGVELRGRTYRRQPGEFKLELLSLNDPRRKFPPNQMEVRPQMKHEIRFPKVGSDWQPKTIVAAELMTKDGRSIFQIFGPLLLNVGNTVNLIMAAKRKT